jgi:hypothetical protein
VETKLGNCACFCGSTCIGPYVNVEESEGGPSPQEVAGVRKLRLRRPRPISIDNEEGIARGNPVPLRAAVPVGPRINNRQNTADLLAAAIEEPQSNAFQSLLATVGGSDDVVTQFVQEPEPILPLRPQEDQPRRQRPEGRRRAPGVPRRSRPRPAQDGNASDEEGGNRRPRPEPIKTTERYSHMNSDGSFTFGYVSEDGSFREETRGVDCITRGKYGYIDPDGKRREFTYVSGLPCDNDDEEREFDDQGFAIEDNDDAERQDPIDPADRFRQAVAVQLTDDEIPDSARRPIQQRPAQRPAQRRPQPSGSFNNFDQTRQPVRQSRPRVRPTAAAPRPTSSGGALQNLLNIADGAQTAAVPQPTPTAIVTRPRPTPTRPRPTSAARPAFNFDSEVDSFTLGRPSLTFQEQPRAQDGTPAAANRPVGPNFSSELVFDPSSGTFKTELRQTINGGQEIRISDAAQPGARAQPTQTTAAAFSPTPVPTTPRPFTAFASTTRRPVTAGATAGAFQPLNFPDPATIVAQRPTSPSPSVPAPSSPVTPARRPTPTVPVTRVTSPRPPAPSPAGSFFFQPFRTVGSPRPVAPGQPATTRNPPTVIPAGTFNLGAGRPLSPFPPQPPQVPGFPRPTPVTQPRPAGPPTAPALPIALSATAASPQLQFGFQPLPPANARPVAQVQSFRPPQPQAARPLQPQAVRPLQPQAVRPLQPQAPGSRPVPFTAFRNGVPPSFGQQTRPVFQQAFQQPFQTRPGGFTAFAPRPQPPQNVQARPPPGFAPRPPQQGLQQRPEQFRGGAAPPGRFLGRPAAPPAGFSVFNPASLRGARF